MKPATTVALLMLAASAASAQDQQLGARAKAMGGSYTAFEDDPVSVWLNPAGIATQPDQAAIAYQSYTAYPRGRTRGPGDTVVFTTEPQTTHGDPEFWPSFLGLVFQVGDPESPMAVGVCFARPYLLNFSLDQVTDPNQPVFVPEAEVRETFSRFRASFAKDFLFKARGETGFFTHLAAGIGFDIGFERWEFSSPTVEESDTSSGFGGGLGLLLGLFENGESFKVNFGVAYQSAVNFHFATETDILPAFDMPQQLNVGMTFYLLGGMPLRVTLDYQWIDWSETAERPIFGNFESFDDAQNLSFGAEYRFRVSDRMNLYPRFGYRRFDAPWSDKNNLPMTGEYRLVLDTKADVFNIFTFGLGLGWTRASGKSASLDVAGDVGGDAFNLAAGVTYEF